MKIKQKLDKLIDDIEASPNGARLAEELRSDAIDAILGGVNSPDWEKYMKNFTTDPEELKRLTLKDGAEDNEPWVRIQAAYMVAYAACGAATLTNTHHVVTSDVIDKQV